MKKEIEALEATLAADKAAIAEMGAGSDAQAAAASGGAAELARATAVVAAAQEGLAAAAFAHGTERLAVLKGRLADGACPDPDGRPACLRSRSSTCSSTLTPPGSGFQPRHNRPAGRLVRSGSWSRPRWLA